MGMCIMESYQVVRKLRLRSTKATRNMVTLLSRVHHRHLVSFVGFCNEGNHEVLIYEYMAQGTLEDHLFEKKGTKNGLLDWKTRLDIVLNASKGESSTETHWFCISSAIETG
ncbi:hypothetical protein R1flu_021752 [Riccia fluitans]|uniref:Serine-threonine/tyrosine-protein kinase catalytic domain-containing protein n=1 Tax=Riccia fluitans TaxID=41844 RepID=A0ABD1ZQA6_9MARC